MKNKTLVTKPNLMKAAKRRMKNGTSIKQDAVAELYGEFLVTIKDDMPISPNM